MNNLQRITGKIFGETATATGDDPQIGQFGSALAGTYVGTTDVATIQNLPAWSNGFIDSVTPNEQFPPLPEMTGVGKVLSYQTAYTLQKGVPEWDPGTTYYAGDFCKGIGEGKLYVSKIDSNINNNLTDTNSWEEFSSGATRNIGEIVASAIPLTDAGLHLLDGALISGSGSYSAFVDYIAGLYNSGDYTAIFETESNWQTSVATYGVCGKFVYDSVNNTVRLPKITGIIEGTTDITALGDLVTAGLPNITGYLTTQNQTFGTFAATGAFYQSAATHTNNAGDGGTAAYIRGINLDASRSNSIYGHSSTVQPQTIKAFYYIVIATSTKTDIEVDIDEIATDLNGKADIDLSNCTKPHIVETYSNDWSWYRVYSDGWCEQGGHATASTSYGASGTVVFLKEFRDTKYQFFIGANLYTDAIVTAFRETDHRTTSSTGVVGAYFTNYSVMAFYAYPFMWQANGYIS